MRALTKGVKEYADELFMSLRDERVDDLGWKLKFEVNVELVGSIAEKVFGFGRAMLGSYDLIDSLNVPLHFRVHLIIIIITLMRYPKS